MDFEARKREAAIMVTDFLADFVAPRGLDDSSLANRIANIADAFGRKMPTDGVYAEKVEAVLMKIRDTHTSNTWPSQAEFIMAMPAGEQRQFAQLPQFKSDAGDRYTRLMNEGQAVPETAIWGLAAASLDVPAETLARYRKGSAAAWQSTYRHQAHEMMRSKYGPIVDDYFSARAAE